MRFVFGLQLDGRTWPDVLGDRSAIAGERWGGPMVLLHTLEGQLGLAAPTMPEALRAASLIGELDVEDAFWRASARVDPFATAMQLIRWDEELRLHGWRGEGISTRLADLVLEVNDQLVLIDHKTFPGSPEQAKETAEGYWGQLDAYRKMLEAATGKLVGGAYVHFPVLGVVVPLLLDSELRVMPAAF